MELSKAVSGPILTSYSAFGQHRQCPAAWEFDQLRGLRKKEALGERVELEFGNWWHALRAADSIHRGMELGSLLRVPKTISLVDGLAPLKVSEFDHGELGDAVLHSAETCWMKLPGEIKQVWDDRLRLGGRTLTEHLVQTDDRWSTRWADERHHERPLLVETSFKKRLGRGMLKGKIDEVLIDDRYGFVIARDHKTSKQLEAADHFQTLMDSQLQLYAWALEEILKGEYRFRATEYDRVRSKAPAEPQLTTAGNLSKSVTDYDFSTYSRWAHESPAWGTEGEFVKTGKNAGKPKFGTYEYEEQVAKNLLTEEQMNQWTQRSRTPLNPRIKATHVEAAEDTIEDMERTRQRAMDGRGAVRNFAKHCQWCDFAQLCKVEMTGGRDGDYPLDELGLEIKPWMI